jgi:hypothetical protein
MYFNGPMAGGYLIDPILYGNPVQKFGNWEK